MNTGDINILQAAEALQLSTIDDLAECLSRNKKSLERRLPRLVKARRLYRTRWASTEPYVYSVKDLSRRSALRAPHELLLTRVHIAFVKTGILIDWQQGDEYWRGQVHQDAFCTLKVGEKMLDVFIEADNATMNGKDMGKKIAAYLSYFDEVQTPFRVLFVTTSLDRAKNLSKLATQYVAEKKRKLYLFTTIEKFRADPFGEVCFIPYESIHYSLIPKLVS